MTNNKVAYIAGSITNNKKYLYDFAEAEMTLSFLHYTVLSPAWLPKGLNDYEDYMRIDEEMLKASDVVFFLDGWKKSNGAKREYELAQRYGKKIMFYNRRQRII